MNTYDPELWQISQDLTELKEAVKYQRDSIIRSLEIIIAKVNKLAKN